MPARRVRRRDARRREARERARRHLRARQGRLARRRRALAAARASRARSTLRVWQSVPHERLPELRALSLRSGVGSPLLRLGYLKVFMDGTLGSQTAWMLDGSGVQITSGEELAEIVREAPRPAGRSACTRSATARTARRSTRSSGRATSGSARGCGSGSSTRSASRRRTSRASPSSASRSRRSSRHAPSDRDLAERFWADKLDGTYSFRSLLDSGALVANGSDAPIEELDPWAGVVAGVRARSTTGRRGGRRRR